MTTGNGLGRPSRDFISLCALFGASLVGMAFFCFFVSFAHCLQLVLSYVFFFPSFFFLFPLVTLARAASSFVVVVPFDDGVQLTPDVKLLQQGRERLRQHVHEVDAVWPKPPAGHRQVPSQFVSLITILFPPPPSSLLRSLLLFSFLFFVRHSFGGFRLLSSSFFLCVCVCFAPYTRSFPPIYLTNFWSVSYRQMGKDRWMRRSPSSSSSPGSSPSGWTISAAPWPSSTTK